MKARSARGPAGRGDRALPGPDVHAGELHLAARSWSSCARCFLSTTACSRPTSAARDGASSPPSRRSSGSRRGRVCSCRSATSRPREGATGGAWAGRWSSSRSARSRGLDVACDVYPYTAGSTSMMTLLPPWALEGGVSRALERLGDPEYARRIRDEIGREQRGLGQHGGLHGLGERLRLLAGKGRDPDLEGKHLAQIARGAGCGPRRVHDGPAGRAGRQGLHGLLPHGRGRRGAASSGGTIPSSPPTASTFQAERPHPRSYGTFPRVLARFVRETGLLTLEEAVRKMTSFPARRFRLGKRGLLAPGHAADLVVFDPETVSGHGPPTRTRSGCPKG